MRSKSTIAVACSMFCCIFLCEAQDRAGKGVYVFKSKYNCARYVLVGLSGDGKKVNRVPRPGDIMKHVPKFLGSDHWMSAENVSLTSAVLAITREDYAKLVRVQPTAEDLYYLIRDKNGVKEVWDCSLAGDENLVRKIVKEGRLRTSCKLVK